MNSHRSSDLLPPSGDFGEMLQSRGEALRHQQARSQGMVCAECGSPLSETSQFCWMCGAARELGAPNSPSEAHAGHSLGPQVEPAKLEQVNPTERLSDSVFQAESLPSPSVDSPPAEVLELPSSNEPELFSQIYGRDRQPLHTEEEVEQEGRKFDYRLIAVPILLALIVFLGYQQRRSARDFFAMMKEFVAEQIAQLWPSEKESERPEKRVTEPSKPINARKRAPARQSEPRSVQLARSSRPSSDPLRVRVEGQPGPLVAPAVAHYERPIAFQRAVAVGITGAMFSMPVPPAPMRVQIAPTESLSLLLRQVPPVYPVAARDAKIEGSVVLKAVIRKDGNVGELSLVSGHPLLVQAAMDAVKQWVYRPYYRNGEPTDVETLVVVEFSLASERTAVGGGF